MATIHSALAEMAGGEDQRQFNETPVILEDKSQLTIIITLGHPTINFTPDELRLFRQLFNAADTDKLGVVTGEVAVKFFEKTRLSPAVLGEVGQPRFGFLLSLRLPANML